MSHPIITKRIKKLGLEEFTDNSVLMKTIQPFNDPSDITYSLPAPAYTSTEGNQLLKERFKVTEGAYASTEADDITLKMGYGNKKGKEVKDYNDSPYVKGSYNNAKIHKNKSAGSVVSAKKSVTDSDASGVVIKASNASVLESIDRMSGDNKSTKEYKKNKYTPEKPRGRESRVSSESPEKENKAKHIKNLKSENFVKKKALQPSEFKMKSDIDESISPTRRMIENNKNRLKSNQSKQLQRNESHSQLSSQKRLGRNESQRTLSKEKGAESSERNKKLIKNLREHIALKLYENNVPTNTNNYHRVVGKSSSISNNSYIQKMLDAYNVFNNPSNSQSYNKYTHKLRRNLRGANNKSKYREDELRKLDRNRSLNDKKASRNEQSPGYPREKSVVLPQLSRSPNISIVSGRKKSIMSLKKKQQEQYLKSLKRQKAKISSLSKAPNKSTDLQAMPSISKQLDRILNSHKISLDKGTSKHHRSPNHYKIKSISNESKNNRRELSIDGLPSAIGKPLQNKGKNKSIEELKGV